MENFDHAFDLPCASSVKAMAWSPSLRCLASGGDDGTIRVWDLVRKQSLFQLSECKECISSLSWSSRGVLAFGHPKSKEICLALLEELPSQSSEAVEVSPAAVSEATESAPSFVLSVQMVSSASGTGASPPLETAAASPEGDRGEAAWHHSSACFRSTSYTLTRCQTFKASRSHLYQASRELPGILAVKLKRCNTTGFRRADSARPGRRALSTVPLDTEQRSAPFDE
ncbi:unnamed protein product [Symbiodinium sp. CCMP2592]|nr:unnamed protein product [Symbiodinium sp. CCMP2592]